MGAPQAVESCKVTVGNPLREIAARRFGCKKANAALPNLLSLRGRVTYMSEQMTKAKLLETIRDARVRWEGLLAEVGEERMQIPGVEGNWSVKDIIAHVSYFESGMTRWLNSALTGEAPVPSLDTKGMDVDQENAWVYEQNRNRSL